MGKSGVSRFNSLGFALVIGVVVVSNLVFGAVNSASIALIGVLLSIGLIFWIAESLFEGESRLDLSYLHLPILGLILLGLFQLLPIPANTVYNAIYQTTERTAFSIDPFATKLAVVRLTLFLVFFSFALYYLNSPKRLRLTAVVLIIFGSVMAFYGILQQLADENLVGLFREIEYAKPFATYVNRHHYAAFLEMPMAIALGLLFTGSAKPDNRVLLVLSVVLMGLGIVFTTSRGALISLVAILAFLSVLTYLTSRDSDVSDKKTAKSKMLVLIGANVALIAFLVVSVAWIGGSGMALRATGLAGPQEASNGRLEFWSNTLRIARDNPVIGTGLDSYGVAYTAYDRWNGTIRVDHAHNDYLQMLSDGGIIGFALIVLFIFLLFRLGLRTIYNSHHPMRRGIAAGALAGCLGILVHSFFDFPLRTNANMFMFLTCVALAVGNVKFGGAKPRKKSTTRKRKDH